MEIILDTSFILTCLKEKIDFLDAKEFGELILPLQVLEELDNLKEKGKERKLAELALDIIDKNKDKFKIVDLEKKFVDAGIKKYVFNKKKLVLATLDSGLKKELEGKVKILTIRARKKLEVV